MPRAKWTPDRDDRRDIARIKRLLQRRKDDQGAINATLAAMVDRDVPLEGLEDLLKITRKTLARHVTAARAAHTTTEEAQP